MDTRQQELLRQAWLKGKDGYLPAREQAKAWALREVWKQMGKADHGMKTFIASKVKKQGGGNPSSEAIRQFFEKIDADREWFPGKADYENQGAPSVMTGTSRAAIARCAMNMKDKGVEPTYTKVIASCPKAARNPKTKQPFSKKTIYAILSEDCYDDDPCLPWEHKARFSKKALTDEMKERRVAFVAHVSGWRHNALWFYNHVIWTDLCSSIIPLNEKKADEMALARKGKKGWISKGSEHCSRNLGGKQEVLKQQSWNTMRLWWFPMLCRGKLHVDIFDADFPGETAAGAERLVEKVRAAVNIRFQTANSKPDVVFTDRGRGFYVPNSGDITPEYKRALAQHHLRPIMGDNARRQPGSLQDVLLHESAVSWLRHRLTRSTPKKCWEETREEYGRRLKRCCEEVNNECDVQGLCQGFPKRMKRLEDEEGDRLPH